MLLRLERFPLPLLQRHHRAGRVYSSELHLAAMATVALAAGRRVGGQNARTAAAAPEHSPTIRRHLPPAGLHANALAHLHPRSVATGTAGPGQGAGQNPEVGGKFLDSLGQRARSSVSALMV